MERSPPPPPRRATATVTVTVPTAMPHPRRINIAPAASTEQQQQQAHTTRGRTAAATGRMAGMRMVASLLLLLLCAGCSPVVLLFGSAQVVAPFSSVEVIAPDPSFPRVDEQYRCSVAMASGSGWTFDYAYLLSLPSGAGEAAVHQSVTGTNVGIDFKTITRTMATVKGQRLQCRVTATNSGGTFVQISSNTITLVNTPPTVSSAVVQVRTPRTGSGSSYATARTLDVFECVAMNANDIDDPPVLGGAFAGFVFNFTFYINSVAVPQASAISVHFGTDSLRNRAFAPNASLPLGLAKRGDSVSCRCTPGDSQDWGDTRSSSGLTVGVTPPYATSVALSSAALGGDGLLRRNMAALCSAASVISPDGDPASAFSTVFGFLWRGSLVSNQSAAVLPSPGWVRGDAVVCYVKVSVTVAGVVYPGDPVYSSTIFVANTAPTTGSAIIAPSPAAAAATVMSTLTCAANSSSIADADGDAPFNSSFIWRRNSAALSLPASTWSLPPRSGVKGDVFSCAVATHDGMNLGPYSPAASLTLANTPPVLGNATLRLDDPAAPTSIICVPGAVFDPDVGDSVARFDFGWIVDGAVKESAANGSTPLFGLGTLLLSEGSFALGSGHSISCHARAVESGPSSTAATSASVSSSTLLLDAPRIVSFAAFSPSNKESVYTAGISFNLTFSSDTDFGITASSAYAWPSSAIMPRSVVDQLLWFSETLGADYEGQWTSARGMLITVNDVRTAGPPRIGTTRVAFKVEGKVAFNLTGSDGSAGMPSLYGGAASISPPLSGDFGRAPPGFVWGALSGVEGEDALLPREFNLSLGETLLAADTGLSHAFLLSSDRVYALGSDTSGQLGISNTAALQSSNANYARTGFVSEMTAVDSLAGLKITAMSSGRAHSLALSQSGLLYVAGSGAFGQTGLTLYGAGSPYAAAAQTQTSGFVELRLAADGSAYNQSSSSTPTNPLWSLVAAGYDFSLVVHTPSTGGQASSVFAWGRHFGSRYNPVASTAFPSVVFPVPQAVALPFAGLRFSAVAAGAAHVLFLTEGGQVFVWGSNREGQLGLGADVAQAPAPQILSSLSGVTVVSIAAGGWHSMLLTNTSATYCFGKNSDGQCGMHPELRFLHAPTVLPHTVVNSTFASWITAADSASFYTNYYGQVYAMGFSDRALLGVEAAYLPVPTLVSGLSSASIASVHSRRDISVALTPNKASPCLRGCSSHGSCFADACQCTPEWTGPTCAVPVCRATGGATCSGNGTCTIQNDAPTCACFTGFTGPDCASPDCATSALQSCSGHGTCHFAGRLEPACSCAVGWKAPDCATCDVGWSGPNCDVLDCSAWNDCTGSQGSCAQVGRLGACVCGSGWVGLDCNTPYCTGQPICSGHGSCVSPITNASVVEPTCVCDDRWAGTQCDRFTCAGSPVCSGRGSCDVSSGTPVCSCSAGFTALDCSVPSCDGEPLHSCSGHGQCVVAAGGAPRCACDSNYSGSDCSDEEQFLSGVVIALIVVGALVGLVIVCACSIYAYKRSVNTHPHIGQQRSTGFFDPIAPKSRSNRIFSAPNRP